MATDLSDVTMVDSLSELSKPRGAASKEASMVMIYGEHLGRRFQLGDTQLLLGRSPDCTVQLDDDSVSRRHAKITPGDQRAVIMDLQSTNGTYVNGTAVSARHLKDGDTVQVGRSIFKFLSGQNIEQAYHEEIYRLKTVDGLTGAVNKRTFEEELRREWHRFFRYGRPLSLIMFDLDHFKKVNDTYGHLAGDRVLGEVGRIALELTRPEDTFCRYGGEEFAILLPEQTMEQAVSLAHRLRTNVGAACVVFDDAPISVTISAGVSTACTSCSREEDFLGEADKNLYAAKHAGRNAVRP